MSFPSSDFRWLLTPPRGFHLLPHSVGHSGSLFIHGPLLDAACSRLPSLLEVYLLDGESGPSIAPTCQTTVSSVTGKSYTTPLQGHAPHWQAVQPYAILMSPDCVRGVARGHVEREFSRVSSVVRYRSSGFRDGQRHHDYAHCTYLPAALTPRSASNLHRSRLTCMLFRR